MSPKELTTEKTKATKALAYASDLVVTNQDEYNAALQKGKEIKSVLDAVVSRKEEITKPLNAAIKSTRELFKPIEVTFEDSLATIKSKMTSWFKAEQAKADKKADQIANKVEAGNMKPETAVKKAAEIERPDTHAKTDTATATMRTVIKYRVVDITKIPHHFLEPNMVAIKAEFRAGRPVSGVEAYEEQELAIS